MRKQTTLATALAAALSVSGYALAAGSGAPATGSQSGASSQQSAAGGMQSGATGDCPSRSSVDANNDGTVSDQEARAHRDEVFAALDADRNSTVSRQEYTECLASLQQNQRLDLRESSSQGGTQGESQGSGSAGDAEGAFAKLDDNSDGYVSAQEMLSEHKRQFEARARNGKIEIEQGSSEGAAGFEAADMNQDGTVTTDEAAAQAAFSFAMVDANSDGRISSQEWSQGVQQQQARQQQGQGEQQDQQARQQDQQGQQPGSLSQAFNAIDSDGNGEISKEEFNQFGSQAFSQAGQSGEPVNVWVYREYYVY